jgi:hypothetical protein
MKNKARRARLQKSKRNRKPEAPVFEEIEKSLSEEGVTIKMRILKDTTLLEVLGGITKK